MLRSLLARYLLSAITCFVLCASAGLVRAADSPHVVLILADDLGYGDLRCYNPDSRIPTEHLDRLAAEGKRFTDAHAPGSVCVPTRYGLLTGRYPHRARLNWRQQPCIAADRPTLPGTLAAGGYRTAMVGKWHLGFDVDELAGPHLGGPVDRGFDTWFGLPASLDIPPYYYIEGRTPVAPPTETIEAGSSPGWSPIQGAFWREGRIAPGFEHAEVLPLLTQRAVRIIEQHAAADGEQPLFLYLALTAPHTPWLPAEPFKGSSQAAMYGDFVVQVDAAVGAVVRALEAQGMTDDTLVIFTSDNGPVWFEEDEQRFDHRSAGPLRGMKGDAWEGGHRVPFIARWPQRIAAGETYDGLFGQTDLFATLVALTGIALPENAAPDSIDQSAALLGQPERPPRNSLLHLASRNSLAVRSGPWKLIPFLGSGGFSKPSRVEPQPGGPTGQLYHLDDDIGETRNLWSEHPEVVGRLTDLLEDEQP